MKRDLDKTMKGVPRLSLQVKEKQKGEHRIIGEKDGKDVEGNYAVTQDRTISWEQHGARRNREKRGTRKKYRRGVLWGSFGFSKWRNPDHQTREKNRVESN